MRLPRLPLVALALTLPVLRLAAQAPAAAPTPVPALVPAGGPAPVAPPAIVTPLPYVSERALGGLKFTQPVYIIAPPDGTHRLFILEKSGRIYVIPDVTKPEKKLFLDLSAEVGAPDGDSGLMAIAFHPDFGKNRQFYAWFTRNQSPPGTPAQTASFSDTLARFTTSATDPDQADPASEQLIITQFDRAQDHDGGGLAFGSDGDLYLSLGDEAGQYDKFHNSQLIDKNFFSGILRLDVDQRPGSLKPNPHASVQPGTYTIPADNPFVGATSFNGAPVDPARVRTEFYAVGLRNPWRISFDPVTKLLWAADVGQDLFESVDLIRKGGNYGWSYFEGSQPLVPPPNQGRRGGRGGANAAPTQRIPPAGLTFDQPLYSYRHTDAGADKCLIGGYVYRGKALPALTNHYIFCDYISGRIWALSPVDGTKDPKVEMIAREKGGGIVVFGQDPVTGDILMANFAPFSGYIERLVPAPAPKP